MATAPHAVDPATLLSGASEAGHRGNSLVRGLHSWHLLSFDAPCVAMLWTWFLARSNHVRVPAGAVFAMGLAVWMLYAADRLLDSRLASPNARIASEDTSELEARHHFHHSNRRGFAAGIFLAALFLALLLPDLATPSVRLYLVLGAMLFAYFIVIHAGAFMTREGPRRLPKELAVGVFFSAAVFIPTVAREPSLRLALLPGALLFAMVCSLNCLFIYAWEHPRSTARAHPATRIALRFLPWIAIAACGFGLLLACAAHRLPWPIPTACAAASALLLLLHGSRRRLDHTTLRAAADLCLLTPIFLLPLL